MSQLTLDLPESLRAELDRQAEREGVSLPHHHPFADVLVGQGGLAPAQLGDPCERERSALESWHGLDAVTPAERDEIVVVEVVLAHQDVEGGEAEAVAPAVVQALDAAAVD